MYIGKYFSPQPSHKVVARIPGSVSDLYSAITLKIDNFEKLIYISKFFKIIKLWKICLCQSQNSKKTNQKNQRVWFLKSAHSGLRQFLTTESPLKMMKNVFYFTIKALFVLKISKVLSWRFGHTEKNNLSRKISLISKFMTSQQGKETILIHILPNISRNEGQLIEYNMRDIFLEKSHTKCVFLKNENWPYLGINGLMFCIVCFYCMPSWGLSKHWN